MQQNSITFSAESVRTQFMIIAVTMWIGFPLAAIGEVVPAFVNLLLSPVYLPAIIVTTVFWCILLYRQWFLLQGHGARTTPGKAVGFGFIPLFGFYWCFVAYAGLATDTNNYLRRLGINTVRMSFGLAVADCILSVLCCTVGLFPKVGAVLIIPSLIVGFILVVQQRDCVLAILEARTGEAPPNT
jgi:hypothetical protein